MPWGYPFPCQQKRHATLVEGRQQPGKGCWGGQSPPDALANLGDWGCDDRWLKLVKSGGRRRGASVFPTTGATPPGAPEWRGDVPGHPRNGWMMASHKLQHPMTLNPPPWKRLSGYCGMLNRWTHQTGGRSCKRFLAKTITGNLHRKWECHLSSQRHEVVWWGYTDHSVPMAPSSLEKYKFMPPPELQFGSWDYQLVQPQKTLTYAKALQHWMEKAQLLVPGEPCHLAESVLDFDGWWSH